MEGYLYILECADGTFYTGSTNDLSRRMEEHNTGNGANYTKRRLPVKLVYTESFDRIDAAFYREKQVQNWNRKKKIALIEGGLNELPKLSKKKFTSIHPDESGCIETEGIEGFGDSHKMVRRAQSRAEGKKWGLPRTSCSQ
ncbi:MAG: GIY-YIG nuclease family protein [Candidatus Marinimicrobia bacterium]|nr:GIY-YIG nuclease family protein [Candidatus Neomarinimicrobiota bacterium]